MHAPLTSTQQNQVPIDPEFFEGKSLLDMHVEHRCAEARENFKIFRQCIRGKDMLWGWWNEIVAIELQRFYFDLLAGRRPKLALMSPPQHGKSWTAVDFIAWIAGRNPNFNTIFASFSEELGERTNMDLQRIFQSSVYRRIFEHTKIDEQGWVCNKSQIEYVDTPGSFRNTTVMGAINGMGLDLGVIDDPVKGRREASSKTTRDMTWNWFADDFMSRFSDSGGLLVIMTRWHVDDLLGRALEKFPEFRVVRYPAIATEDEYYNGVRLRKQGEVLFHELKSIEFLDERRKVLTEASWEALYQQNPIIVGGGILPIDKLTVRPLNVLPSEVRQSVRYWDKAGTIDGGAFTAGVLMHAMLDGTFVIGHICRGQWSALEREKKIKAYAESDAAVFANYSVGVEQEPGSGGKESVENTIRNLAGFRVYADKVTGNKEFRCEPFAAQVQGGNVSLLAGMWIMSFLDECETFPNGKYKDQVDACSGAFANLIAATSYNQNYAAWA